MKTSKYSDSLIMSILKQAEAGTPIPNLCREHGMSSATFYKWKQAVACINRPTACVATPHTLPAT